MKFLLKAAFWLTIIVLLLPADSSQRTDNGSAQVGAIEALGVAQSAVEDAGAFCLRRPDACETGAKAFQTFGQKAQYGAKMLYEFLSDRFADHSLPTKREEKSENGISERPGRHTLTPADMAPVWNNPERKPVPLPPRRPA